MIPKELLVVVFILLNLIKLKLKRATRNLLNNIAEPNNKSRPRSKERKNNKRNNYENTLCSL